MDFGGRRRGVVRLAGPVEPHGTVPGMTTSANPHRGFRFPAEVIEHAVWLSYCFSLSLRDVEVILAARGVVVWHETTREWGLCFGRLFANTLKRRRPKPGDRWFMDEVFIRTRGKVRYLCTRWTRTETCSTPWFKADAMPRRPSACSASCCAACNTRRRSS